MNEERNGKCLQQMEQTKIFLHFRQMVVINVKDYYYYYYYYNSSIALNLKQYYSKRFTVHKIQYTCTIKHISRIDTMR
jgi:hypothetical protein